MLSQTAEYALRAVVHLAQHHGEPRTVDSIARATKVPVGYLAKIMQQLTRAGLTTSQRGLHGGFVLTRAPGSITLYEPLNAVDPFHRITSCPLQLPTHRDGLCSLHRLLDATLATVEQSLRATTIGSLLEEAHRPLCPVDPLAKLKRRIPLKD